MTSYRFVDLFSLLLANLIQRVVLSFPLTLGTTPLPAALLWLSLRLH